MGVIKRIVRLLLIIHGILNAAQGIYCVVNPSAFAEIAGPAYHGASDQALQSIGNAVTDVIKLANVIDFRPGLGAIGVGIYGAAGAVANQRSFYAITVLMRLLFGTVVLAQHAWDNTSTVVMYEYTAASVAAIAVLT